ncbi:hypothetical protein AVEN_179916-1 [Araneus ventricosus]|uniref:Uncharacterized protein n=1 Tax=Araneus ventricosus TaxID=182803 RepID=A0A4Y2W3P3_ARAVE|nr:hypothetical protein AVEN_147284-1 [Araneus ventricosus]GBO30750.1 hypothetical protein AVEN_179916-1 [Araneus ventricosus]
MLKAHYSLSLSSTQMAWWQSRPFHSAHPFTSAIKWQFRTNRKGSLRSPTAPASLSSSKHEPPSAPISFRAIKIYPSSPHICGGSIYGLRIQMDCKRGWKSKLSTTLRQ